MILVTLRPLPLSLLFTTRFQDVIVTLIFWTPLEGVFTVPIGPHGIDVETGYRKRKKKKLNTPQVTDN